MLYWILKRIPHRIRLGFCIGLSKDSNLFAYKCYFKWRGTGHIMVFIGAAHLNIPWDSEVQIQRQAYANIETTYQTQSNLSLGQRRGYQGRNQGRRRWTPCVILLRESVLFTMIPAKHPTCRFKILYRIRLGVYEDCIKDYP